MKKYYYYLLFCLFITLISVESCSKDKDDDLVTTPEIALNKPSLIPKKGIVRLITSFTNFRRDIFILNINLLNSSIRSHIAFLRYYQMISKFILNICKKDLFIR